MVCYVQLFAAWCSDYSVWPCHVVDYPDYILSVGCDVVDVFSVLFHVVTVSAVAWVGEVDSSFWVGPEVVWAVKFVAGVFVCEDG